VGNREEPVFFEVDNLGGEFGDDDDVDDVFRELSERLDDEGEASDGEGRAIGEEVSQNRY
jgi:hypothetical protein